MRAVSPQAGCAEVISADLTCSGDQPGCCCSSSAAAPETCGAAMLVPSKTANGAPANSGSVEERICPPGAATSGFSWWSKLVGPPEEKLVMIPLRPVWISFGSLTALERKVVRPPWPARYARRFAPSRSAIIPAGKPRSTAMKFASPERLSTSSIPVAPAFLTRSIFETNVQPPRETSATAPLSEPATSGVKRESFGSKPGGAQSVAVDRLPVRAVDRADVDERLPGDPGAGRRGR